MSTRPSRAPEFRFVDLLTLPVAIAELVLLILYWVRIHGYNKLLTQGEFSNAHDEEDDRPRPPRREPTSTDIQSNEKEDRYK